MTSAPETFGPFVFDRNSFALLRDGKPVPVANRGLALIDALLAAEGQVVSKAELMDHAWPGTVVEESNLSVQVAALRKTLGTRPDGQDWIVTVPRVGYRLIRSMVAELAVGGGKPSMAVLPFSNLSGDGNDAYFADGIVEDLTTALSRFGTFSVVSRSSAFVYKDRAIDVREAAKELGVRYVLEGGVRRSDKRLRVTAKLLDAETGLHLWADKFDGDLGDIFDFQDRIADTVVGLIEPQIRLAEIERARRKRPENLDAYDLYLRALPLVYGMDSDGFRTALELLQKAIALDPGFAIALAFTAWTLEKRLTLGLPSLGPDDRAECLRLARLALAADADEPLVIAIAGWLTIAIADDNDTGLAALRRAVVANPNNLVVLTLAGSAEMLVGDLDASLRCFQRAIRLSPNAPDAFWSLTGEGTVQLLKGNFEGAIECCQRSLATFNEWPFTYWALIPAYVHLGRMDEGRAALQRLLHLAPQTTVALIAGNGSFAPRWKLLTTGMEIVGMPPA
jgi:TolB-like protein